MKEILIDPADADEVRGKDHELNWTTIPRETQYSTYEITKEDGHGWQLLDLRA